MSNLDTGDDQDVRIEKVDIGDDVCVWYKPDRKRHIKGHYEPGKVISISMGGKYLVQFNFGVGGRTKSCGWYSLDELKPDNVFFRTLKERI